MRRGTFPQLHTILITYHFLSSHFPRYDKGAKQRCGAKLQLFLLFFIFPLLLFFFHTEAAGGSCGFCISVRPNFGGLPARRWLPCVGEPFATPLLRIKNRRPYIAPPGISAFSLSLFPLLFSKTDPRKIQGVRFSCHSIQTVVSTGSPWTYLWSQSSSKAGSAGPWDTHGPGPPPGPAIPGQAPDTPDKIPAAPPSPPSLAPRTAPVRAPTAALRPEWFTANIMLRSKSPEFQAGVHRSGGHSQSILAVQGLHGLLRLHQAVFRHPTPRPTASFSFMA